MAELTGEGAGEIKKKKLPLADDRFHVAPEQIKQEHVPEEMPRAVMQKSGRNELPAISVVQPAIAQRKILADEPGLVRIEKKLGDKHRDVYADQAQQDDPRPLDPTPRSRRRFPAREAHVPERIPTRIRCRWIRASAASGPASRQRGS